jgi:hypothetical protein
VLSVKDSYGVGEFDYVAFRSSAAAERMAERYGTTPIEWSELREAHGVPAVVAMALHAGH